ncbi:MAG: hypothetical protein J6Q71_03600 [Bacteroidales bacterium]|nr:hypothetical protein [Bacteroidales bacterium]MBO7269632.1 hypothetical protein [Bacteroidales bacterium]
MKNLIKVSILRELLIQKQSGIDKRKGIYCWWFNSIAAQEILSPLKLEQSIVSRIQKKIMNDGIEYWALYFGVSKDMLNRAKWHVLQEHTITAVKYGTLSTLRQTISALLNIPMSISENAVNQFIDANCYWEWEYNDMPEERERLELSSSVCYPLNIKENRTLNKDSLYRLKQLRKLYKDY